MRRMLDIATDDEELSFLFAVVEHSNHYTAPLFAAPVERLERLVERGLLARNDFEREHRYVRYTIAEKESRQ